MTKKKLIATLENGVDKTKLINLAMNEEIPEYYIRLYFNMLSKKDWFKYQRQNMSEDFKLEFGFNVEYVKFHNSGLWQEERHFEESKFGYLEMKRLQDEHEAYFHFIGDVERSEWMTKKEKKDLINIFKKEWCNKKMIQLINDKIYSYSKNYWERISDLMSIVSCLNNYDREIKNFGTHNEAMNMKKVFDLLKYHWKDFNEFKKQWIREYKKDNPEYIRFVK